ncbi:hypothetical protein [Streptomyces scabiei]|uniref:hypothetical protein n=1 Tax=Streptomyces scabiei TaxID=1930 RepID=UPI000765D9D2|nr:hypothetical protein [Streptomyces scabiei]
MADDWSSRVPDHVHQLDLCPDCEGLRTTRLDRLPGLVDLTLHGPGGAVLSSGPAVVHIGPVPGPCPNTPAPSEEAATHG